MSESAIKFHQSEKGKQHDKHGTCPDDLKNKDARDCPHENSDAINTLTTEFYSILSLGTIKPTKSLPQEDSTCQILHPSPQKRPDRSSNPKLLILSLNGLLADARPFPPGHKPNSFFRRPFCSEFLQFCLQKFYLGVWSSKIKRNTEKLLDFLFGDSKHQLLFCWDQSHCTDTGLKTPGNRLKPVFLKELKKIWIEKDHYNESNTLMLDDSPYKALGNPPYTAIFPPPFRYQDKNDTLLAPGGSLQIYLEGLAESDDVQEYVSQNPFGQPPVSESHPHWHTYRMTLGHHHKVDPRHHGRHDDGGLHRHGSLRKTDDEGFIRHRQHKGFDNGAYRWRRRGEDDEN